MTNEEIIADALASTIKHMSKDPIRSHIVKALHKQMAVVPLQTLLSHDVNEYLTQVGENDRLQKDTMDELRFRTKLLLGLNKHSDVYALWKSNILEQLKSEEHQHHFAPSQMIQPWVEGMWLLCMFKGYFSTKD